MKGDRQFFDFLRSFGFSFLPRLATAHCMDDPPSDGHLWHLHFALGPSLAGRALEPTPSSTLVAAWALVIGSFAVVAPCSAERVVHWLKVVVLWPSPARALGDAFTDH